MEREGKRGRSGVVNAEGVVAEWDERENEEKEEEEEDVYKLEDWRNLRKTEE